MSGADPAPGLRRHGNHHPLALPTAQLLQAVKLPRLEIGNAAHFEQFDGPDPGAVVIHSHNELERRCDLITDR